MVTTDAAHKFWTKSERSSLQKLAEQYERNVEITYPDGVKCFCGDHCPFAATKVKYPKYTGPSL